MDYFAWLNKLAVKDEVLKPLHPLDDFCFDRSTHAVYGEKATEYYAQQAATPFKLARSLAVDEEKAIYLRFCMNIDPTAIRFLHAYYTACGLVKLEDRIQRFKKLYQYRN